MMKAKSLDFITGYVFAKMVRSIFKHFGNSDTKETLVESHSVPKIWFGLPYDINNIYDITVDDKYKIVQKLNDALNELYPKLDSICYKITTENQHLKFHFRVKYKEQIKKMTVEEIEKELGYKIEIVSDN